MIKTAIIAGTILGFAHGAVAAPYVEVESNSSFTGNDYTGGSVYSHGGYEGELGENATWFVQAGPELVLTDGAASEVEFSGKAGTTFDITESTELYNEVSFITGNETSYGLKAGVRYSF